MFSEQEKMILNLALEMAKVRGGAETFADCVKEVQEGARLLSDAQERKD